MQPSIGSVGDAYDNALAETTIGLYKNEFVRADSPFRRGPLRNVADVELIEIAASTPQATLCLTTALARHDLTDEIPTRIDVAVPRGARVPKIAVPVMWHMFNAETFEIGRETLS